MKRADASNSYSASITREPFLFREMRTVSRLQCGGMSAPEIKQKVAAENLFQYPTERSVQGMAHACLRRLSLLNSEVLVRSIASSSSDEARQICLYALMKDSRLVRDFMVTVIGEKYRVQDLHWNQMHANAFLLRMQEQQPDTANWSSTTITKIRQILVRLLVDNGYLENLTADKLNSVWLYPTLEQGICANHDEALLPAFNCFSKEI